MFAYIYILQKNFFPGEGSIDYICIFLSFSLFLLQKNTAFCKMHFHIMRSYNKKVSIVLAFTP